MEYDDSLSGKLPTSRDLLSMPRSDKTEALARRDPLNARYDTIYPMFIRAMAMIGAYGAEHYGEGNWMKSRLTSDKSPVNHIHHHLIDYQSGQPYDHTEIGEAKLWHLAAIAFNAMMEFYYEDTHTK